MESILVLTHADETGSALTRASLEAVTAGMELAAQLKASLTIGIVAADAATLANALASTGARLLTVSGEAFAQARYASDAAACEALCRAAGASIVLAPGTSRFTRVVAGVAHRLCGFIDTHITALGGAETVEATRWFYRQRVEAGHQPRRASLVPVAGRRHAHSLCWPARYGAGRAGRGRIAHAANYCQRLPRTGSRCTDHPTRCPVAARCRRRMDEEATRWPDACERGWRADPRLPAHHRRIAGQQQIAGGPGRRGELRSSFSDASESDWTNGRHTAPRQGPLHLLPRRRAARCGLAFHRRPARYLARSQLRLDARQGRRGLRR